MRDKASLNIQRRSLCWTTNPPCLTANTLMTKRMSASPLPMSVSYQQPPMMCTTFIFKMSMKQPLSSLAGRERLQRRWMQGLGGNAIGIFCPSCTSAPRNSPLLLHSTDQQWSQDDPLLCPIHGWVSCKTGERKRIRARKSWIGQAKATRRGWERS